MSTISYRVWFLGRTETFAVQGPDLIIEFPVSDAMKRLVGSRVCTIPFKRPYSSSHVPSDIVIFLEIFSGAELLITDSGSAASNDDWSTWQGPGRRWGRLLV